MQPCRSWLWMSLTGALVLWGQPARADDWGCQVLLCLSDPRGPTTERECRAPISKLRQQLAKGRAFPTCAMAGDAGRKQGAYVREVRDAYDPCPVGTQPVSGYIAAATADQSRWRLLPYQYSWAGQGAAQTSKTGKQQQSQQQRACVRQLRGTFTDSATSNKATGSKTRRVQVYDAVVWQKPHASPQAMDVFIDGQLHHRVRF